MSCSIGSTVSFDVLDVRCSNVRTFDQDVSRVVLGRSGYPAVRYEGRYYELFRLPGSPYFIDLDRPHGSC